MNPSKIETLACWPDRKGFSWNPITGCSKVSPGCTNCWAGRMAPRQKGRHGYPLKNPFRPTFHDDRLGEPGKRKKPAAIAVGWMGDLFFDRGMMSDGSEAVIHPGYLFGILEVIRACHQHIFFLLTKRPKNMLAFLEANRNEPELEGWPFPNVAVGVSVENADYLHRIDTLLKIPAAMRYVSFEPLLGAVDFSSLRYCKCPNCEMARVFSATPTGETACPCCGRTKVFETKLPIDWVVVGGESGPRARPMNLDWVRSIQEQCANAGTPVMFKQWGEYCPACYHPKHAEWCLSEKKSQSPHAGLKRVDIEGPHTGLQTMVKAGKKHSGRFLGWEKNEQGKMVGVEHMSYPEWFGRIEAAE